MVHSGALDQFSIRDRGCLGFGGEDQVEANNWGTGAPTKQG